jgi:hypothetical protein
MFGDSSSFVWQRLLNRLTNGGDVADFAPVLPLFFRPTQMPSALDSNL